MVIKFGDNADEVTMGAILEGLAGWTLDFEYKVGVTDFPLVGSIDSTSRNGIVICDVNEAGKPLANSQYHVDYDDIVSITVV